ncbi:hypothetical protein NIES37_69820 (plasmid) [Tolypothrix tenuis PCC 7101]|uniref:Uncharacterized protein n=1 Tax=Tolypothrix tenuis PCC 7101 TaxID=231146 RepID=A0A1Z4NB66_9CYAN|nr:hypothetical protein [Aulosira sp. FACHB-113]BAZ02969.1 hypothetical protein NIES37_69820 [Tolypothrix tenuis PCC 7101]BAZ78108.1 hypothetical protein NIES50_67410 [Aulosira laxa NIES-50]
MTTNKKQSKNNDNKRQSSNSCKLSEETDNPRQYKNLSFRIRAYSNTVDGKLIIYLQKGNGVSSSKEMVLQALRMCWLPLAYQAQANVDVEISDQEVHQVGLICCHALEQHLAYLRMALKLPHQSSDVLSVPLSTMSNSQTLATMFGLNIGNSSSNDENYPKASAKGKSKGNENSQNNNQQKHKIDSDLFIPGTGSFYDETDSMFDDI